MTLGNDLRNARKRAGLTLAEVAARSGLTAGHLSLIERERAKPSIGALIRICDALGVRVGDFFSPTEALEASPYPADGLIGVVRRDSRKTLIYPGSNIRHELLCPDLQHALEVFQSFVPVGEGSGTTPISHEGEECAIVLRGEMQFHLGERTFIIRGGESICFHSIVTHTWTNIGTDPLEVIWVVTPPHF